jgi:Skp family chaperone for outer membrane proteins
MNILKTLFIVLPTFAILSTSQASSLNIGVVNYVEIENKALVSKDIAKQIQDRQTKHQSEIKNVQNDVQKKVADLEKSSAILTAKALEAKKASLQKELIQIDENLKIKSEKLESIKNNTLVNLNNNIKDIVTSIAKKQGLDIVISENSTLYYNEKNDITSVVIKELDSRMPKMKIDWEEAQKKKK